MEREPILFVSSNQEKLASTRSFLAKWEVFIKCQEYRFFEFDIDDLFLRAVGKATEAFSKFNCPILASDTGFYIESYPLNPYFPGVFIERDLLVPIGVDGLLEKMAQVPNRKCWFQECLVYYDGDTLEAFYGYRKGNLLPFQQGEEQTPLCELWTVFQPLGRSSSLAQLSLEERYDETDGHTEAIMAFARWYSKRQQSAKVLRKSIH